jgi:hypothetical protein
MISRRFIHAVAGICLMSGTMIGAAEVAWAQEPTALGKFQEWEAYTYRAKDSRVCYIFAAPRKSDAAKKVKRDPIYFMITHWPGRKVRDQISTIIGYPFKDESLVKLQIDDKAFDLYTNGDMAWADGAETDKSIVSAMKNGSSLTIVGTSWRGTETVDTYSLSGVKAAMDKIDSTCK